MTMDFSLHILLWLCSMILTPVDSTWVIQGEQGPPMALVKTAAGFTLQPPKGVEAPALPVAIKGTEVKLGDGKRAMKVDVAKMLPVTDKSPMSDLPKLLCSKERTNTCFETISLGVGRAQVVFVNAKGNKTTSNLARVDAQPTPETPSE